MWKLRRNLSIVRVCNKIFHVDRKKLSTKIFLKKSFKQKEGLFFSICLKDVERILCKIF